MLTLAVLALFCRLATGLVFAYSSVAKLIRLQGFVESLEPIGIVGRRAPSVAVGVVAGEGSIAAAILLGSGLLLTIGSVAASVALLGLTGFVLWRLRRPRVERGSCICFGRAEPYEPAHVVRNVTFLTFSLAGIVATAFGPALPSVPLDDATVTLVAAGTAVALVASASQLLKVIRLPTTRET